MASIAAQRGPALRFVQIDDVCRAAMRDARRVLSDKSLRITIAMRDGFTSVAMPEDHIVWALSALLVLASRRATAGSALRLDGELDREACGLRFAVRASCSTEDSVHRQLELTRARRLLAVVGGSVALTRDGDDAIFEMSVPLPREEIPRRESTSPEPTSRERGTRGPRDILLAEDDDHNVATVGDYLTSLGYEVSVARDGHEAVAMARRHHPSLILMDVQMPGMDGLTATREIRADDDALVRRVPIIALTALAMDGDRARCLAAGADAYMMKPVSLKALAAKIEERLRVREISMAALTSPM
jgi:CheY-like chemotaxis protein